MKNIGLQILDKSYEDILLTQKAFTRIVCILLQTCPVCLSKCVRLYMYARWLTAGCHFKPNYIISCVDNEKTLVFSFYVNWAGTKCH